MAAGFAEAVETVEAVERQVVAIVLDVAAATGAPNSGDRWPRVPVGVLDVLESQMLGVDKASPT